MTRPDIQVSYQYEMKPDLHLLNTHFMFPGYTKKENNSHQNYLLQYTNTE